MAVFQGARFRNGPLPANDVGVRPRPASSPARSDARVRPMGLLMAAIIASTMFGLVYLTQTLGSNATSSEIRDLAVQSADLDRKLRTYAFSIQTNADPLEITKRARKRGLVGLGDAKTLPVP